MATLTENADTQSVCLRWECITARQLSTVLTFSKRRWARTQKDRRVTNPDPRNPAKTAG